MAQAQSAIVWLEPEEQQEQVVLRRRQRRTRRAAVRAPGWLQHPLFVSILVAGMVALLVAYISAHAMIARHDWQRQKMERQLAQLEREQVQNLLTIDRLAAQPRLIQLAQQQGLEQPTADRIQYVRVASSGPRTTVAHAKPAQPAFSWLTRSRGQLVATLHRLGHAPGEPVSVPE